MRIRTLDLSPSLLGESPVWDADTATLFWVDTVRSMVRGFEPASGRERAWPTPSWVGSIALASPCHLVAALRDGFYLLDLATDAVTPLWRPEPADGRVRFNDGKTDRAGRFLCGSMGLKADPVGKLYRLDAAGQVDELAANIAIANGLCFSPAGDIMYFADSITHRIMAYDYEPGGTHVGPPRLLIDTSVLGSGPDGATVDAEGFLWVALVRVGRLARISPAGVVDALIDLPVDLPSCPAFGGPGLDTLYVTSIKDSGSGRAISRLPDGGRLVAIEGLGVRGLPEARFQAAA